MTTISEVAKTAGVSKATVSRVLSGNGYVSQAKREQVFQAIAATGFRPNLLARNLAAKSSHTIGLVMTNTLYAGSYFTELMQHSARMLEQQGRQLLLVDGKHSAEEERAAIQFLLDLRCDGIIIYPRFLSIEEMDALVAQYKHPLMVINRQLRQHDSYCIYVDQQLTSAHAVEQLTALGHRDIAFVTGSLDSPTGQARLAGYKTALTRQGITVQDALIVEGKWQAQQGVMAVETLLARGVTFSAVVASNDEMAIGVLQALAAHQIAVPQQVAVLGFDDIPLAPYTIPALASVKMPVTDMIKETLERLTFMLDGGELRQRKNFCGELQVRASIGPGPYAAHAP